MLWCRRCTIWQAESRVSPDAQGEATQVVPRRCPQGGNGELRAPACRGAATPKRAPKRLCPTELSGGGGREEVAGGESL
jgi:hypothetical protein